jgi:hypothetical protein
MTHPRVRTARVGLAGGSGGGPGRSFSEVTFRAKAIVWK